MYDAPPMVNANANANDETFGTPCVVLPDVLAHCRTATGETWDEVEARLMADDAELMSSLEFNISEHGILEPIEIGPLWTMVNGHKRVVIARRLKIMVLPAVDVD